MNFSEATPNPASLWSPSDNSHMNVSSVHLRYKLCFLLLSTCCFCFFIQPSIVLHIITSVCSLWTGTTVCTADMPVNFCRKVLQVVQTDLFRNDCHHILFLDSKFVFILQKHNEQLQAELKHEHMMNMRNWPQATCCHASWRFHFDSPLCLRMIVTQAGLWWPHDTFWLCNTNTERTDI